MFRADFMRKFALRKYGNPVMSTGNINTDFYMQNVSYAKTVRVLLYGLTGVLCVIASRGFDVFYEVFFHPHPPSHVTFWQKQVPADIRALNDPIIEGFIRLNNLKDFKESIQE